MFHSGKALKECLQARLPVQHAQHPISDVNTSRISREGRRLVNGYTAWALGITSLLISLNPREKIHNKRTWITAYLTDGATRLGPVGMRTRTPDHRVSERLRSQVRLWSPLPIILHCTSARDVKSKSTCSFRFCQMGALIFFILGHNFECIKLSVIKIYVVVNEETENEPIVLFSHVNIISGQSVIF